MCVTCVSLVKCMALATHYTVSGCEVHIEFPSSYYTVADMKTLSLLIHQSAAVKLESTFCTSAKSALPPVLCGIARISELRYRSFICPIFKLNFKQ